MKKLKILVVAGAATMLSSCDLSQIPGLDGKLSIEDSKAVGAACRHSGRALEDCFALNPKTHQAGVFDGWRDMNDYMLANEIEVVKPEIRNSAFEHEKVSTAPASKPETPATAAAPGAGSAGAHAGAHAPAQAVPLVQGRQRWSPKAGDEAVSAPPPLAEANAAAPAPGAAPGLPSSKEQLSKKEDPPAKEAPAAEAPARPWERKKDPKKHT